MDVQVLFQRHTVWTCSMDMICACSADMQKGHAACACCTDMQDAHAAGTCSMDMHPWHAAWPSHAAWHAARTCIKDLQQGHAEWVSNMDMQHGQAPQTCSMDMHHGYASWTCCRDGASCLDYHHYLKANEQYYHLCLKAASVVRIVGTLTPVQVPVYHL